MRSSKPTFGAQTGQRLAASVLGGPGLRERKKAALREKISDTATGLFLAKGFDEVTVAQVAEAVDVSVKTVFNYFSSKEDLLFDREPAFLASLDALAELRAPGLGLIRVMQQDVEVRWPAMEFGRWDALDDRAATGRRAFYALVEGHPGLQARRRQMTERAGERIGAIVGEEFSDPQAPDALAASALVSAAYLAPGPEYTRQLLSGAPAVQIVERARAVGLQALSALERAYAGTSLVDGPAAP
ncbi:MAG: TetR/AcrR family transcriptional regulator [Solirubrobacteraceae bacterium]|nr:TetR/AcrR family transcriptional regulator [Solirubrobacteraceae bacterium]